MTKEVQISDSEPLLKCPVKYFHNLSATSPIAKDIHLSRSDEQEGLFSELSVNFYTNLAALLSGHYVHVVCNET